MWDTGKAVSSSRRGLANFGSSRLPGGFVFGDWKSDHLGEGAASHPLRGELGHRLSVGAAAGPASLGLTRSCDRVPPVIPSALVV